MGVAIGAAAVALALALTWAGAGATRATPDAPTVATAERHRWLADASRSRIGFVTRYAGGAVEGRFGRWTSDIVFDPTDPASASASIAIDLASTETGSDEMDAALVGADWFDVAAFPEARFHSERIHPLGGDRYEAEGRLGLRGVTLPIRVPMRIVVDGDRATATGEIELDRSLFGVGQGTWSSDESVPRMVRVAFHLVARRAGSVEPAGPGPEAVPSPAPTPIRPATTPVVEDHRPKPAFPGQTMAKPPARPSRYRVESLASGLDHPWSMAFLPDGGILLTERPGRMRLLRPDGRLSPPLSGVPAVKVVAAQGLHDLLLDPDFARNRTLYFTYFAPLENDAPPSLEGWIAWLTLPAGQHRARPYGHERIARAMLSADGASLTDVQVIAEGADRRLALARDGTIFAAAAPPAGGGVPVDMEPQRLDNSYGKVLRLARDGAVPRDNPFAARSGVVPSIYAYGLRDMEGAAIHPTTGLLWTVEHGPRGGDEVNVIRPGRNYGFPLIGYGREYSGAPINGGRTAASGLEQPVYFWTPSIAPSGMSFYRGRLFPEWRNSLFVGALAGKRLIRLELKGERVMREEPLLAELGKRIRDVREGPDGAIYVLTDEKDGELLRLLPAAPGDRR